MKVLFVTSEAAPFVKTGGLGDISGTLPGELKNLGADVRIIMPLYNCIPEEYKEKMSYVNHIYIDMAWRKQYCGIFEMEYNGCMYYFIDNKFYFGGDYPYSYIHEDVEKFSFFSKAALSVLPTLQFRPDVIHCNDWQTGPVPVYLDVFQNNPFYRNIKTIMTVHNLKFQGRWDMRGMKDIMGISDSYFTNDKLEFFKDANLLKGGIVYADKVTTVSESYAEEITTPEYGEGLHGLLYARRGDLVGILNGISYTHYNPETDNMIFERYSAKNAEVKKGINKVKLQELLNLPQDENKFMIGIISRLTDQKGFDLIGEVIEQLCALDMQIVVLGTGHENVENMFRHYAWKYPDRLSANIYFSNELAHKIYAASDAVLMPSRFEPCGLTQLIGMRYGTLPIVRETGGLRDTVIPYNEYTGEGTGFSFEPYNSHDMLYVIEYAREIFSRKSEWNAIVKNAMSADFSWRASAEKYMKLYDALTDVQVFYDMAEESAAEPEKKDTALETEKNEKIVAIDEIKAADKKGASKQTVKKQPAAKKKPAKKSASKPKKEREYTASGGQGTIEKTAAVLPQAEKTAASSVPAAVMQTDTTEIK